MPGDQIVVSFVPVFLNTYGLCIGIAVPQNGKGLHERFTFFPDSDFSTPASEGMGRR
jgi:hypothetical protein